MAVQYATTWNTLANPLFCRYNYPGRGQACLTAIGVTNCTNFTSQAVLYGGFPMTQYVNPNSGEDLADNARWMCRINANGVCERPNAGSNWSGARPNENPEYFLSFPNPVAVTRFVYPSYPQFTIWQTLPPRQSVPRENNNPRGLAQALDTAGIGIGDLLFMEYTNDEIGVGVRPDHMAIIVGWGPYLAQWDEFTFTRSNYWYEPSLAAAKIRGNIGGQNNTYVPYVVDHGRQGEYDTASRGLSKPRPYYFLFWQPEIDGHPNVNQKSAPPSFLKVPRTVQLPIPPAADGFGRVVVQSPYTQTQLIQGTP
jgi:hypothetical protein